MYENFEFANKNSAKGAIERKLHEGFKIYMGDVNLEKEEEGCVLLGYGIYFCVSYTENKWIAHLKFSGNL